MSRDYPLSTLNLDYLYSLSNVDNDYAPKQTNILSTWEYDEDNRVKSFENINTDPFNGNGHIILFHRWKKDDDNAHWIPIIRNRRNDAIIFDSLGKNGILTDKTAVNLILDKLRPFCNKVYVNTKQYQQNDTSTCGKYTMFVISYNKLKKGANIQEIQNHLNKKGDTDKYLNNLFKKEL